MSNRRKPSGPTVEMIPEGDNKKRLVCPDCGFINYANPKVVVGAVCEWQGRILLCRRAIKPRLGYWTPPGGFLELGETTAEGAKREAWEEACARIQITSLIGIYEIPRIDQIHVFHNASLTSPVFEPGEESQETALFSWDEIPWEEIAFSSGRWALERVRDSKPGVGHEIAKAPPGF